MKKNKLLLKTKCTDEEYLQGIKTKNSLIIESLIRTYLPKVSHYIKNNNGNDSDARDMLHQAILILYGKLLDGNFVLTSELYTYLHSIIKFKWLRELSKRKTEIEKINGFVDYTHQDVGALFDEVQISEITNDTIPDVSPDEYLLYQSKFNLLNNKCKEVLKLFFLKYKMIEIAKEMQWSEGYAKKEKYHCQKKLIALIKADNKYISLTQGYQHK